MQSVDNPFAFGKYYGASSGLEIVALMEDPWTVIAHLIAFTFADLFFISYYCTIIGGFQCR